MTRLASNRPASPAGSVKPIDRPTVVAAFGAAWRELCRGFLDTYRPERHYMRGPGPKWREKHGAPQPIETGLTGLALRGATA